MWASLTPFLYRGGQPEHNYPGIPVYSGSRRGEWSGITAFQEALKLNPNNALSGTVQIPETKPV